MGILASKAAPIVARPAAPSPQVAAPISTAPAGEKLAAQQARSLHGLLARAVWKSLIGAP